MSAFVTLRWLYVGLRDPTLVLRWPSLAFVSLHWSAVVGLRWLSWVYVAAAAVHVVVVAVGLVLTWRGCIWQERPTSHRDLLVVVVGVVARGVRIDTYEI